MRFFVFLSIVFVVLVGSAKAASPGQERFAIENCDVNGDLARDLSDAMRLLGHLFLDDPAPVELQGCGTEPALVQNGDANHDENLDVSDAVHLLGWLFSGGPQPAPACGVAGSGASDDDDDDDDGDDDDGDDDDENDDGTASDPAGDTVGTGPVQHDILEVSVLHTETDLLISATVADSFSLDPQDARLLIMIAEIDTDQNADTGIQGPSNLGVNCPDYPSSLRADFVVGLIPVGPPPFESLAVLVRDIRDFVPPPGPGNVPPSEVAGSASTDGNTVTLTVPLSSLGGDDGEVNVHLGVGTLVEATDCAPDGSFVESEEADDDDDDEDDDDD